MKVTDFTRRALHFRRSVRRLKAEGYRQAKEPFWELYRGNLYDHEIVAVEIGPDKKSLWCKIAKREST